MDTDTTDFNYESDDIDGFFTLLGLEGGSSAPALSNLGSVRTKQGRLLAFPNVLQHRVPAFELQDKSKAGQRKILALFLVDPHVRVLSTGKVPPQQRHWWGEALAADQTVAAGWSNLPAEVKDLIFERVEDFPIGLEEAKVSREELMEERGMMDDSLREWGEERTFNFCEH